MSVLMWTWTNYLAQVGYSDLQKHNFRDMKGLVLEGFDPTPTGLHSVPQVYVGHEETGISPRCPRSMMRSFFLSGCRHQRLSAGRNQTPQVMGLTQMPFLCSICCPVTWVSSLPFTSQPAKEKLENVVLNFVFSSCLVSFSEPSGLIVVCHIKSCWFLLGYLSQIVQITWVVNWAVIRRQHEVRWQSLNPAVCQNLTL